MSFQIIKAKGKVVNNQATGNSIVFDELRKLIAQLKFVPADSEVMVTISPYNAAKERETQRTAAQNRYYHKILDIMCDYTGDTHMDMHQQLKVRFLAKPYVLEDKEYMIVTSTTELTPKNFSDYLDKIFHWAAEELNVSLPSASEYY